MGGIPSPPFLLRQTHLAVFCQMLILANALCHPPLVTMVTTATVVAEVTLSKFFPQRGGGWPGAAILSAILPRAETCPWISKCYLRKQQKKSGSRQVRTLERAALGQPGGLPRGHLDSPPASEVRQ